MTTTINHKIRLELELSLEEYVFLDYIYQSKKKTFTVKDFYNNLGFSEDEIGHIFRSMRRFLEWDGNKISTNKDWNKHFDKKKGFVPPTEKEVVDYFKEKGYKEISGKKAFEYYDAAEWSDSNGKPIKNWKQKMIGIWFKDENKAPVAPVKVEGCPYSGQQLYEAKHYYESDGIVPAWFDKQYINLIQ